MTDPMEDIFVDAATGNVTKIVHAPDSEVYKARTKAKILQRLSELDQVTGPRWLEGFLKGNPDPFVMERIAEKESLRAELAQLNE